uniref:Uncharacterized protein n=1 Tax=Arundo donax TaxID=35708 RepID=A0A0A9D945_ARUDO
MLQVVEAPHETAIRRHMRALSIIRSHRRPSPMGGCPQYQSQHSTSKFVDEKGRCKGWGTEEAMELPHGMQG